MYLMALQINPTWLSLPLQVVNHVIGEWWLIQCYS